MSQPIEVLVLDDEPLVCERLRDFLEKKGVNVETFGDSGEAIARLDERSFDVVITDVRMAGPSGLDVLRRVKELELSTQVIVMSGFGYIETYREAEVVGAFDFISKPFQMADVFRALKKAARRARRLARA